jgi:uncharacterized protein
MDSILTTLSKPWPWYVAGPLIGLTVPLLLLLGNKSFGISSNLRHVCAALLPSRISFFNYAWRNEIWNLLFAFGIVLGGTLVTLFLASPEPVQVNEALKSELAGYGITDYSLLVPTQLFAFDSLFTLRGFVFIVFGGFLVGFSTRYAGGCTSGHAIMGLSTLQWPSLLATVSFMIGGILTANFLLPLLFTL